MSCYYPVHAWRARDPNDHGKYPLVYDKKAADLSQPITRECGLCIGCRLERSRQWAQRCVHEASTHDQNCFITLTYSEEKLPPGGTLNKRHWQAFMKRLRKSLFPKPVRFYMCGEYGDHPEPGETLGRPHYHAILFGWTPPDLIPHTRNQRDEILYTSETLARTWNSGHVIVGQMTFDSAAYVARYCTKKITGDPAAKHYGDKLPEFSLQSNAPGIGRPWFDKYRHDCDRGHIHENGIKMPVPKYYLRLYERDHPYDFEKVQEYKRVNKEFNPAVAGLKTHTRRKNPAYLAMDGETELGRLHAKETIKQHQLLRLQRNL